MSDPAETVQNQLAKLKKKYAAELPQKVARTREQIESFLSGTWTEETCFATYRQIHSLAGSAGTYGFIDLGATARSVELSIKRCLDQKCVPGEADRKELAELLVRMKELAEAAAR